jgi:hypothetical protein
MRDDRNPTLPPQHVLRAFPVDLGDAEVLIRHRTLTPDAHAMIAKAIAQETAAAAASFPRGAGAPPMEVMRTLRMPRWYSQRVVAARKRLTPELK